MWITLHRARRVAIATIDQLTESAGELRRLQRTIAALEARLDSRPQSHGDIETPGQIGTAGIW